MGSYKNRIKFAETTYNFALLLGYLLKGSYKTFKERLYFGLLFWLPIEGYEGSKSRSVGYRERYQETIWRKRMSKQSVIRPP